jgi:hypothetical protein
MSNMKIYDYACIYKLESADGSKVYYGSTSDYKKRMSLHKSNYKRYLNGTYHYVSSFDIIKNPGYTTAIIEEFTKISRQDLEKKESEYIQNNNCINKLKLLNDKEKIENKKKHDKNYYNKNKSKINEKFSCACGGQFTKCNKSKHEQTKQHQSYIKSLQPIVQNITNNINSSSGINITIKK